LSPVARRFPPHKALFPGAALADAEPRAAGAITGLTSRLGDGD
jgi:hypothetical protein